MLLNRQFLPDKCFGLGNVFEGDDVKLPCRSIRRVANAFGEPERSKMLMFALEVGLLAVFGFGVEPLFDFFNISTADNFEPGVTDDFELWASNSFLKSIKLVLGVPNRSEHVCGTSVLFDAQLCLPLGVCGSKIPLGVERPELAGEFPCDRIPFSCDRKRSLSSSVSEGLGDIGPSSFPLLGVDVLKLPIVFLGSIGEIFILLCSRGGGETGLSS